MDSGSETHSDESVYHEPINSNAMNNFYARINLLPKEKLFNYDLLPVDNNLCHENLFKMYPPDLLTNEAIEFFNDYNLKVKFVVNFITPLSMCPGTKSDRVLHTDNCTVNGIKVPIVCGINFELSMPTDTTHQDIPRTCRFDRV